MELAATELPGVHVIRLAPIEDERGAFVRLFDRERFGEWGLAAEFATAATSVNPRAGTLRGLHYQTPPHEQRKLIRCVRGRSYHVALDVRRDSPTFGRWTAARLDSVRPE